MKALTLRIEVVKDVRSPLTLLYGQRSQGLWSLNGEGQCIMPAPPPACEPPIGPTGKLSRSDDPGPLTGPSRKGGEVHALHQWGLLLHAWVLPDHAGKF